MQWQRFSENPLKPIKDSYYIEINRTFFLLASVASATITNSGIETENVSILLPNVYVYTRVHTNDRYTGSEQ